MPITPLHLGLALPIAKRKDAVLAFIVPNVLLDLFVVHQVVIQTTVTNPAILEQYATTLHASHSPEQALVIALISWAFFRTRWGLIGAMYGAFSHILVDALVHADVLLINGSNPMYMGWMTEVSIALGVLTLVCVVVWFRMKQPKLSAGRSNGE